jgi:predicted metal-dependent hydrolase
MPREILIQDKKVPYTLKQKKVRRMSVSVYYNGSIVVSVPMAVGEVRVAKFLDSKSAWIERALAKVKRFEGSTLLKGGKKEFATHKDEARNLVQARLEHFNKIYQFKYKKIFIRNQKSRWGSCSEMRNLSFNFRIVHLPTRLQDYLIVHELCHLKEMNHSERFWSEVARAIPSYKVLRKELKTKYILGR